MTKLLHAEETHALLGACFEVYKIKGCGFLEAVFQECLELEFGDRGIPFQAHPMLQLEYKGRPLRQTYQPDFLCYGTILLEIKAVTKLADEHRAQVHNYLHATRLRVGLLVNFGHYPLVSMNGLSSDHSVCSVCSVVSPPSSSARWKCVVAYDGTQFNGWQSQEGGNTIQDLIERQLKKIFGQQIRIEGSGRTDSGVHALAQVFHFDAVWRHGPEKLRRALQNGLPRSIQLKSVRRAKATFHARFDASGKIYRYHLDLAEGDPFTRAYSWPLNRDLDWPAVRRAAKVLRGKHDFWAFSGENDRTYETTVRHLRRVQVARHGRKVTFTFEADGFLYKMVRSLTGALVNVGLGKLTPAEIAGLLKSRRRIATVVTAPPQGLFLVRVIY